MSCGIPGVTEFFKSLNNTVDKITSIAGGAVCALTNPENVIAGFASGVLAQIQADLGQLTDLFDRIIKESLRDLFGVVLRPVKQFLDFLNQISSTLSCIQNCLQSISDRINGLADLLLNNEKCKTAAAMFGKCIGAKIAQGLTKKIAQEINKGALSIQDLTLKAKQNFFTKSNVFEDISKKLSDDGHRAALKLDKIASNI